MKIDNVGEVVFFEATSIGDAWAQVIHKIMGPSGRIYDITKGSYEGIKRAGIAVCANIQYPGTRPLAPIMPEGKSIPAPTSEDDIVDYFSYLATSQKQENEHYTYGEDLWWQMNWVIRHYREGGHGNNHCYMTVGRPETVNFYDMSVDYSETIIVKDRVYGAILHKREISNEWNKNPGNKPSSQCLRGIDTWVSGEKADAKLNFWVYFRSWDAWGGFPVNLGGIQLLKEFMADQVGVKDGILVVSCKDLHVYGHTFDVALSFVNKDKSILEGR
jgi:thymidylate synthase